MGSVEARATSNGGGGVGTAGERAGGERIPSERRGLVRLGLLVLAIPQLSTGIWALLAPRDWYESFPGFGDGWLPAYGAYDEHLVTDVGAYFLAVGILLVAAAWFVDRRLVQVATVTYLVFELPHFIYHLGADDRLSSGDQIVSGVALAASVLVAVGILALARAASRQRPRPRPTGDAHMPSRIEPRTRGLLPRLFGWYARRSYGRNLTPIGVYAHHPRLMLGYGAFAAAVERSHEVDDGLKQLGEVKAAAMVGCEWCMDFGSDLGRKHGVSEDKLRELPRYRESDAFSELERLVLDYAAGMTRTPAEIDDELFARLRERFTDAQLVELTNAIAIENLWARFNWALGIQAQGFSEGAFCVVPEGRSARIPYTAI